MTELHERVAALEQARIDDREQMDDILAHVKSIDENMNRYKGFLGAIWFAISCIGVFFSAFKFFHKG
jgi:hypothetical protein